MRKTHILLMVLASFLTPTHVFCKGENDLIVQIKNGLLFNNNDLEGPKNKINYTQVFNTLQQSIGISYRRSTVPGITLIGGVDFGYERYAIKVKYPFTIAGFAQPTSPGPQYERGKTVPNIEANIGIGYKARKLYGQPEVRIGQIVHSPLAYQHVRDFSSEKSTGLWSYNFEAVGDFGKSAPNSFIVELLNYVYIGGALPVDFLGKRKINLGVQLQKQMFMTSLNYYHITYYDNYGFVISKEQFNGRHASVSLVLGLTW